VVSFKPRPLYIQKSASGTNWRVGWVCLATAEWATFFYLLSCFAFCIIYIFLFLHYLLLVVIIIITVTNSGGNNSSSSFFCLLLCVSMGKGGELKHVSRNQDISRKYLSRIFCKTIVN
jgi:hypothetical protein